MRRSAAVSRSRRGVGLLRKVRSCPVAESRPEPSSLQARSRHQARCPPAAQLAPQLQTWAGPMKAASEATAAEASVPRRPPWRRG
jgi:hypothetical protein